MLVCFLHNSSFGQVSFGIKSGINIATTNGLIAYPENRIGWYAGGIAVISLNKKLFLQPELLYSSKGDKSDNNNQTITMVTRLNYLNAPLLFGYKINNKLFLLFGPELGYLISAHIVFANNNIATTKSYPPKFDISLDLGVNYMFTKNIGIEVRYAYGFNTLYSINVPTGNRYVETNGANRVFQIGLNYKF